MRWSRVLWHTACTDSKSKGALIREACVCKPGDLVFQMGSDGNTRADKPQYTFPEVQRSKSDQMGVRVNVWSDSRESWFCSKQKEAGRKQGGVARARRKLKPG